MCSIRTPITGEREVLLDLELRIDDGRNARTLIPDHVRSAAEIVMGDLAKDHRVSGLLTGHREAGAGPGVHATTNIDGLSKPAFAAIRAALELRAPERHKNAIGRLPSSSPTRLASSRNGILIAPCTRPARNSADSRTSTSTSSPAAKRSADLLRGDRWRTSQEHRTCSHARVLWGCWSGLSAWHARAVTNLGSIPHTISQLCGSAVV